MMDVRTSFNQSAAAYEDKFNRNPLGDFQRRQVWKFIKPWLRERKKLLDVGCGPGSDFEFYGQLDCRLTAIDISEQMTRLAKEKALRIRMAARIENSGIEDFAVAEKYDAVVCNFGVLNAVEYLPVALEKIRNLLTEDGILIAVVMPPFQMAVFLADLLRLRWTRLRFRLLARKAETADGFAFNYVRRSDLKKYFKILAHRNLGVLLPPPDGYSARPFLQKAGTALKPLEKLLGRIAPACLGGDHVCYILKPKPAGERPV